MENIDLPECNPIMDFHDYHCDLETNNEHEKDDVLVDKIPIIGKVALMFYIPYEFPNRIQLIRLILQQGGAVVPFYCCNVYQLVPDSIYQMEADPCLGSVYYNGFLYSHKLVIDSINCGSFKDPSDYVIFNLTDGKSIYSISERRRYTLVECIQMSRVMQHEKYYSKKVWRYCEKMSIIPGRPTEGMRSTYKKY